MSKHLEGPPGRAAAAPADGPAATVREAFDQEFRGLFADRFPGLFRYLHRASGDAELAADLAQEAFVKLYHRGAMPDDPAAWLVSVASNLFRDERRRVARRLRLLSRYPTESLVGDAAPAADVRVLADERRRAVRAALERLPERERRLLLLREEGYSYRELAVALDLLEASVGTLLARARLAFRSAFTGDGNAPV